MKKLSIIIFILMILSLGFSYIIPQAQADFGSIFSFNFNSESEIKPPPQRSSFPIYYMEIKDMGYHLVGSMDIFFINLWDEPLDNIQLNLPANMTGQNNITVSSLKLNNRSTPFNIYTDKVIISLPQTLMPEDTVIISLTFETHFRGNFTRFGKYDELYLLTLWYPVIAPRTDGRWVSFSWVPHADPYFFEASVFHVDFYTDKYLISPHPHVKTDNYYKFKTKPVRDFSLIMGHMSKISQKVPKGPEIIYYSMEHRADLLENAVDIFKFYSKNLGPYPYPTLILADVPMEYFKGMEFSGMIFFNDQQTIDVFTLAHELAHQWWYGLVGNDQIRESWIDEGLANYWAYKYCQSQALPIADVFRTYFSIIGNSYRGFPIVRKIYDFPSDIIYRQAVYLKGANFWMEVEEIIGERETFKFLRGIQEDYQYGIITTDIIIQRLSQKYNLDPYELYKLLN